MTSTPDTKTGKLVGWVLSVAIVTGALALGLLVIYRANYYPRTDDSEILANFIGIAPQVDWSYRPLACARQPARQARGPTL